MRRHRRVGALAHRQGDLNRCFTDSLETIRERFSGRESEDNEMISRKFNRRRGVILLVVLGLLSLFALTGITFVLVAGQHQRGSTAASRREQYGDPPSVLLNEALLQVLRGTNNPYSVIGPHSLLEDLYGSDGEVFEVQGFGAGPMPNTNGQLMIIQFDTAAEFTQFMPNSSAQHYAGRVLTMLEGPAAGISMRIVQHVSQPADGLVVLVPPSLTTAQVPATGNNFLINGRPFNGTGFGYDSTTGLSAQRLLDAQASAFFGSMPPSGDPVPDWELALLPNPRTGPYRNYLSTLPAADEDYDVADFQNMLLAFQVTQDTGTPTPKQVIGPSLHRPALINYWIARMAADPTVMASGLAINTLRDLDFDPARPDDTLDFLRRSISLRPDPKDHPDFANVNPLYDPVGPANPATPNARWDVDNDGDGREDSIWVDLGFPVQTAPDGRQYKPLFAILCLDMDGRLNINAHGTTTQRDANDPRIRDQLSTVQFRGPLPGMGPWELPVGSGYSTAEINLSLDSSGDRILFGGTDAETTLGEYAQVLHGRPETATSAPVAGRYGEVYLYGDILSAPPPTRVAPMPGLTRVDDNWPPAPVDQLANFDAINTDVELVNMNYQREFIGNAMMYSPHGSFGSPPDLDGDGAVALNLRGQPIYGPSNDGSNPASDPAVASVIGRYAGWGGALDPADLAYRPIDADTPYLSAQTWARGVANGGEFERQAGIDEPVELDLSPDAVRFAYDGTNRIEIDSPYTVEDLEWILRPFDVDSGALESRLARLAPNFTNDQFRRTLATTDSWDLPVPAVVATNKSAADTFVSRPLGLPDEDPANLHVIDLLRIRLENGMAANIDSQISEMLPRDVLEGLRFDLNRAFGNNIDDDDNGVVDDPGEAFRIPVGSGFGEWLWRVTDTALIPATDYQENGNPPHPTGGLPFDHYGDGSFDDDDAVGREVPPLVRRYYASRYQYAKTLYVLMMLFKGEGFTFSEIDSADPSPYPAPEREATRIAQWAVNVVDFRDRDSIHTPFEFDYLPFNADGWNVDGNVNTNNPLDEPDRLVVWGCERPELLITETLAFHDRRTTDTDLEMPNGELYDPSDPMKDQDFDQEFRPQGSFFVEIYNPWNAQDPRDFSAELYYPQEDPNPSPPTDLAQFRDQDMVTESAVSLAQVTPMVPSTTRQSPVWRLAITMDRKPPEEVTSTNPERFIYFVADAAIVDSVDDGGVTTGGGTTLKHAPRNSTIIASPGVPRLPNLPHLIKPGHYAIVGPEGYFDAASAAHVTPVGRRTMAAMPTRYRRNVLLDPTVTAQAVLAPAPTHGAYITNEMGNVVAPYNDMDEIKPIMPVIIDGVVDPPAMMMSASIIRRRLSVSEPLDGYPLDASYDYADDTLPQVTDRPFDFDNPVLQTAGLELANRTELKFRFVHLQRLANPLLPWNPEPGAASGTHDQTLPVNPYITIDGMDVDLSVYHGLDEYPPTPAPPVATGTINLESRRRANPGSGTDTLWSQVSDAPSQGDENNPLPDATRSLGYLNVEYSPRFTADPMSAPPSGLANPSDYYGDPNQPFPWLTWHNRPFSSAWELLLVPASSPARLLREYVYRLSPAEDHYQEVANVPTNPVPGNYPYPHLLNFFTSDQANGATETRSNFYRLFEYVHVPSRYSGNETFLDPQTFSDPNLANSHPWHPPFNRISDYREPGRVNINTITDDGHIWRGIMNGFGDQTGSDWDANALWRRIVGSRRGYMEGTGTFASMSIFDDNFPTFFGNPFRSFGNSYLVPIDALREDSGTPRDIVEGTLFRPDPGDPTRPLFAFQTMAATTPYNDTDRNPYFRYQAFQKLGNMLTTRSNVYAVWITVGFFEVERVPIDPGHPDGYQIGMELGSDIGDVTRHRAFYIIDRTRPVGFIRGQDINVDDAILLERIIE